MARTVLVFALAAMVGCSDDDAAVVDAAIDAPTVDGADPIDAPEVDAPEVDAPDALEVDAPVDAIDAPPATPTFAVTYADRWVFGPGVSITANSMVLIINPAASTAQLDLSGLEVVSVSDNHPTIAFNLLLVTPAAFNLPAGQAAGRLSPAANAQIAPLAPEPRFNTDDPSFAFTLTSIPSPVNVVVNASAVVRIGTQQATLPFVFTIQSTGQPTGNITGARRISSVPL